MKITCMGDSITYGFGLEPNLSLRWSDLAAARTGHELINCGVSGDTTGGMLARCQTQVFPHKPDILLILGGINDISMMGDYRLPQCNMAAMVRQALSFGIKPLIGILPPVSAEDLGAPLWEPDRDNHRLARLCEEYAQWLKLYCKQNGFSFVDFRSPFFAEDGSVRRDLFQDGLHPTAQGHALMSQALCQALDALTVSA